VARLHERHLIYRGEELGEMSRLRRGEMPALEPESAAGELRPTAVDHPGKNMLDDILQTTSSCGALPSRAVLEQQATSEGAPELRGISVAGMAELWQRTLGSTDVTIAVLDGPCDIHHPSLRGAELEQLDGPGVRLDGLAAEHGTFVASIVFGQHDTRVRGIAPRARGLIVPVFKDRGPRGITPCSQPELARAILRAVDAGADIINVSGGQFSYGGAAHPALVDAVGVCQDRGRLLVAAAGNDGCPCLHVPGALPSVLAVGAMRPDGTPTEFSNWGDAYRANGVLAPGVDILGALPGERLGVRTGTSYAAPIVSGLAALLASLQRLEGQPRDLGAVRAAILDSALGCAPPEASICERLLAGRLNVSGAVSRIANESRKTMSNSTVVNASDFIVTPTDPARESPEAPPPEPPPGVRAAGLDSTPEPPAAPASGVTASACACQHHTQLVFAIGDLDVDFGTLARLDSLQQNAEGYLDGSRPDIRINGHLIRHLLGWRELRDGEQPFHHEPHVYDAESLIWVLRQDDSPVYAIRPSGTYAADAYLELIHFLMEQEGYPDESAVERGGGKRPALYYPSLDTANGGEPNRKRDPNGCPTRLVERVAIPGVIDGTVKLYNGQTVPVIRPNMRGTRAWNMKSLVESRVSGTTDVAEMQNLARLAQRFFEEARNRGLSPEERALNFIATQTFGSLHTLRVKFGANVAWELDSIAVKRSPTCREDSDCYDVETAFFDPDNVLRSKVVIARTTDVSDEVPVLLGDDREYRRR
jgi:hypothetical protein